jgi:peroxiredoxin
MTQTQAAPRSADLTRPKAVGDRAPDATLTTPDGATKSAAAIYRNHPTVLIFYRGGWCPYCNKHLAEVGSVESNLRELGYQIVAVSPDKPQELQTTLEKEDLGYQLFSDSDMTLARRFGLAFVVDDATIEKYRGYNIDLERSSGRSHHELPVPAVYIIDQTGTIRFAHTDTDYRVRLSADSILKAATAAANKK